MWGDTGNIPIGGGFLLALIFYGLLSVFVTGPVIGERTIERSGWNQQCRADLSAALRLNEEPNSSPAIPKLDCKSVFGLFGREGQQLCRKYGNPDFKLPGMDVLVRQQRRKAEFQRRRLAQAARGSSSRCKCAMNLTLEKRRTSFALYAGSARLITPAPIKHLSSELNTSLRSSQCAVGFLSGQ